MNIATSNVISVGFVVHYKDHKTGVYSPSGKEKVGGKLSVN